MIASPGEHLRVGHRSKLRIIGNGNDIVPAVAKLFRDDRREHLVEKNPNRWLLTHVSRRCLACHSASAARDSASRSASSASISSAYAA